jgi:molecular chaperone GrpE
MKNKKTSQNTQKDLTSLQDQVKSLEDNWKRALADYQNLTKRIEADKKDFVKFATANIISQLIPTLDILDMADQHSTDPGIHMAVKQFHDVLENAGLQTISPAVGDQFDHQLHDCIETLTGGQDNTIAELVTKGYKIDSLIIKPAKVKVFKSGNIQPEDATGPVVN